MTDVGYALVVVGGGTGNNVAAAAAEAGLEVALIEEGKLGGTCLNRGCNPSKMLIQRADLATTIESSEKFGISASIDEIDYAGFVEEMDALLGGIAERMEERYREKPNLTLYKETARFVDERTLSVGDEQIRGEKVVIAAGSRPLVPPIDGLDEVDYLTSTDAIYLREPPESLVVLGGGYIAVELGYFFEAMGTDVTVIEMMDSLVPREDPDVAAAFTEIAGSRHEVYTGHRVTEVAGTTDGVAVTAETEAEEAITVEASDVLVALGRRPNSDRLDLDAAGVETDDRGFVETDEQLRTTAENVWAQGDVAGNFMFKHSGDYETDHVVDNVVHDAGRTVDYTATPHAIFTDPQIGGVGKTEDELAGEGVEYVVGTHRFEDTAMGRAKKLDEGFAKVLAAPDGEILGCHVLGYEASTLIHEAAIPMRHGLTVADAADTVYAHPTISKVMKSAFEDAAGRISD